MEVFDAIRTVLALRAFQNKPLPGDVAARTRDAGRLTASAEVISLEEYGRPYLP